MLTIDYCDGPSPKNMMFVVRAARNPKNSWGNIDSYITDQNNFVLGENDRKLLRKLRNAGSDDRKYLRQMPICMEITAPMYWWKEFDTYKVGTVRNSCSTMHKIMAKPFELPDFSFDKVDASRESNLDNIAATIDILNELRDRWLKCKSPDSKKVIWYTLIQFLPSSYNQKASVTLNYETALNMYEARKNHKLDEWHVFCNTLETLPFFDVLIM